MFTQRQGLRVSISEINDMLKKNKDNKATRVSSWDQLHVDKNAETQTDRDPFWEQLHVETRDKHSNSDQALT